MDTDDAHRSFINLLSKISVGRGGVGAGGTGSVVLSSSRPAPYVPEDLVAQAQSVLQGNLLIFFNSLNTNRQNIQTLNKLLELKIKILSAELLFDHLIIKLFQIVHIS